MRTQLIHVVYDPAPGSIHSKSQIEDEVVLLDAPTLAAACQNVMAHTTIDPQGRLVRFFDEDGIELFDGDRRLTSTRTLRLDDKRWETILKIADKLVPYEQSCQRGKNVNALLRLIADGELVVTNPPKKP